MKHVWIGIGALLVAFACVSSAGVEAHAQTCAPTQAACPSGACCPIPGVCCPSAIGGCCDEDTPYCCGDGTCAVALTDCRGSSSPDASQGCAGYDVPCGAGCIPAGAQCCDETHYCPPTTICASTSASLCVNGTSSPPTEAWLVGFPGSMARGSATATSVPPSPIDDPPNATARSCALGDPTRGPRFPLYASGGVLALAGWRRRFRRRVPKTPGGPSPR